MGSGAVKEIPDYEVFEKISSEYDKLKAAGLSPEELHGVLCNRWPKLVLTNMSQNGGKEDMVRPSESTNGSIRPPPIQILAHVAVTVPVNQPKPKQATKISSDPKKPAGLVLLIDDSSVAAKVASKVLVVSGFDVVAANSAKMGFDILLARKNEIDLIFLDVVMPTVDGVECLSWIKDNADVSQIPVYMLSGLEDQTLTEVCLERGAEGMLLKPLDLETVQTIMRSHDLGSDDSSNNNNDDQTNTTSPTTTKIAPSSTAPLSKADSGLGNVMNRSPPRRATRKTSMSLLNIGSSAPAFKLLESDFNEFIFPPQNHKKHTLLLFVPTIFCHALYEENGFMMRFFSNYDLIMSTKRFTVACVTADLPYTLSAAKKRFKIPFPLLSDPSLYIAQRLVGTMDIGSIMAQHQQDNNNTNKSASHPQQRFNGPTIGMVLLSRKREILNKWIAEIPPADSKQAANLFQFPNNFKDWLNTTADDSVTPSNSSGGTAGGNRKGSSEAKENTDRQKPSPAFAAQAHTAMATSAAITTGRICILIVDDSSVSSRVVCKKLEAMGYGVQAAYNGQQGYEALKKKSMIFSIVLCDVMMPICDGMGFLKLIKADEEFRSIPVVMLSGLEGEELSKSCLDLGASSLLKKPFDEHRFVEIMQELGIIPK